jgi:hypothetical protein
VEPAEDEELSGVDEEPEPEEGAVGADGAAGAAGVAGQERPARIHLAWRHGRIVRPQAKIALSRA